MLRACGRSNMRAIGICMQSKACRSLYPTLFKVFVHESSGGRDCEVAGATGTAFATLGRQPANPASSPRDSLPFANHVCSAVRSELIGRIACAFPSSSSSSLSSSSSSIRCACSGRVCLPRVGSSSSRKTRW